MKITFIRKIDSNVFSEVHNFLKNFWRYIQNNMIFLFRHATEVLDGPLTHKAYVMPICLDNEKESLSVCRKYNYRAMRLPIDNYVKWVSITEWILFN